AARSSGQQDRRPAALELEAHRHPCRCLIAPIKRASARAAPPVVFTGSVPWGLIHECGQRSLQARPSFVLLRERMIEDELNALGRVDAIEIDETAAVIVEQIEDEITVSIASVVSVYLQLTPEQAIKLSRALAVAAERAAEFLASGEP
ncbi:MAG: hypothetical protein E6471_22655, partial [Bradyrhizobium sp.]|nr:hypothetical protein [Bradyrhizobium sp.]